MPIISKYSQITSDQIAPGVTSKKLLNKNNLPNNRLNIEIIKIESKSSRSPLRLEGPNQ